MHYPATTNRIRTYSGAVSFVTGASSGIGRALAEALAAAGSEVVLADRQLELAGEVAEGIRSRGGRATAVELDVSDRAAVGAAIRAAHASAGRLDYLFNNAGIAHGGELGMYEPGDFDRVIDVNLRGVVNGTEAAYPLMRAQGFGHIVNTASMAGLWMSPLAVSYATTKYAVVGLSRTLRVEAAELGIRVSALCPGVVRTPLMHGGKYGKLAGSLHAAVLTELWEQLRPISPEYLARKTLAAVAKNRGIIIVPWRWRLVWWLDRLSPWLGHCMGRIVMRRTQKILTQLAASQPSG